MIKSITVINYLGDSLELDLARPEKSGFVVESITGLGPGKSDVNITEIATSDGAYFDSARVPSRNIVLTLMFLWKSTIEETRHLSYKFFPLKKKITLLIQTDTRLCYITGYVESNEPNIFSDKENTTVSIVCPDPFFYSAGDDGITVTNFYSVEPLFEFPFENSALTSSTLEISRLLNLKEKSIVYTGDYDIGILIKIHAIGEATSIKIHNTGTREFISIDTDKLKTITGSGITEGDDITISTVKGSKYVRLLRKGNLYNIINCLDRSSSWFSLAKGDNLFAYTAETGLSNLQLTIENQTIYEGV